MQQPLSSSPLSAAPRRWQPPSRPGRSSLRSFTSASAPSFLSSSSRSSLYAQADQPCTAYISLLENPYDAESLHWCSDDAFEISTNDAKARQALSAKWDFRS